MEISTQVMQVIRVNFCRGKGTDDDRYRTVTGYFDLDGNLLAEKDPIHEELIQTSKLKFSNPQR